MKVRAKEENEKVVAGYFNGKVIYGAEVFEITPLKKVDGTDITEEDQFSDSWMEKVDDDTPLTPKKRRVDPALYPPVNPADRPLRDPNVNVLPDPEQPETFITPAERIERDRLNGLTRNLTAEERATKDHLNSLKDAPQG